MGSVFIYTLCEPKTQRVRYIGKSVNPRKRFSAHLCRSSKEKTHLGAWLRQILKGGELPVLVVLQEVPEIQGSATEIRYIRIARESLGLDLVNGTDGGDGASPGIKQSRATIVKRIATRKKIRLLQGKKRRSHFGKPWSKSRRRAYERKWLDSF